MDVELSIVDGNSIAEFKSNQIIFNGKICSIWHTVAVLLHSLFHIFFCFCIPFGSYFQLKLQSFWHFVHFLLLFHFLSYIFALSTKILINFKYSICDARTIVFISLQCILSIHMYIFALYFAMWAPLFGFYFSVLKHWENRGLAKVHLHRIHFERTNTRRDLFPLFVYVDVDTRAHFSLLFGAILCAIYTGKSSSSSWFKQQKIVQRIFDARRRKIMHINTMVV